eukprot:12318085-Alexandrium_andersonii.AAC.1
MSASLVGSEMCIRDRRPSPLGQQALFIRYQKQRKGSARPPPPGLGKENGKRSCLLYTSPSPRD